MIEQIKKDSFKVPEGYFDNFQERMLQRIAESTPEQKDAQTGKQASVKKLTSVRRLYWSAAAACVALVIAGAAAWQQARNDSNAKAMAKAQTQDTEVVYSDSYIEEAADFAMLDNQDMYQYMANAE